MEISNNNNENNILVAIENQIQENNIVPFNGQDSINEINKKEKKMRKMKNRKERHHHKKGKGNLKKLISSENKLKIFQKQLNLKKRMDRINEMMKQNEENYIKKKENLTKRFSFIKENLSLIEDKIEKEQLSLSEEEKQLLCHCHCEEIMNGTPLVQIRKRMCNKKGGSFVKSLGKLTINEEDEDDGDLENKKIKNV